MGRVTTWSRFSGIPPGTGVDRRDRRATRRLVGDAGPLSGHRRLARRGVLAGAVAANPDALVLLSVRDPESWYRSASNTIFLTFDNMPPEVGPWMDEVRKLLHDRFSDRFDDPTAMMDAFVRHNDAVHAEVPAGRLLEWIPGDGWEPICERLGLPVPAEPFPITNTTDEFREMVGIPPLT